VSIRHYEPEQSVPGLLPAQSTTDWSSDDGASCDDGRYCTGADTCLGGECVVHAGKPCEDSLFCIEEEQSCCAVSASECQCRLYVDTSGDDGNFGSSWDSALETVGDALSRAVEGCDIWVAEGTYYPPGAPSREATFQ
jgi:hypothetical protein